MNYYQHHIGDFNNATRHLTRLERSVYRDLIELYYESECELPADKAAICRLILARSNEEATVVEQVLNEFFTETLNGYFHSRCDAEILKYKANNSQKAQAGKASAEARAARLAEKLNGRSTGVEQTLNGTPTNQEPITNNQEPNKEHTPDGATPVKKSAKQKKSLIPDDFGISDGVRKWAESKGHGNLEQRLEHFVNTAKAKGYEYADWDAAFRNAITYDWAKLTAALPAKPVDSWAGRDI